MYHVYKLYQNGYVVYVGETIDPKDRLYRHTGKKSGKFYGQSVTMNIISSFDNREDALQLEGELKKQYGFEWTEKTRGQKGGRSQVESGHLQSISSKGGKTTGSIERTCPHCNKPIKGPTYFRFHGNNCKHK